VRAAGKEMAKPRVARSARIAELNLDPTRIAEQPSTNMPGTVDKKIIRPRKKSAKAQISIDGPDKQYRTIRIENNLIDEHGDNVSLNKGEQVDVTVTTKDVNWRR
jgi:predicted ATP-grasp superfamily ATP-dependent carboligase